MKSITLRSPAKLNLFLKVLNKRPDGYHSLQTLFERIDLCDDIRFTSNKTGAVRILCDHPHVPKGPKNLVYRVAVLLKEKHGIKDGVDIEIKKRIPVAAGLAGGSSNAATTLLGLSKIWKLPLTQRKLVQYGKAIGSDVPFFLHDCSWGLGVDRGDKIKKLSVPKKLWHVLVVPRVRMYSQEVFTKLNLQLTKTDDDVNIFIHYLKKNNVPELEKLFFNDLESSILRIKPKLFNVKKRLQAFGLKGVAFSGSGPAVFGLTRSKEEAKKAQSSLHTHYKQVFVVRTL